MISLKNLILLSLTLEADFKNPGQDFPFYPYSYLYSFLSGFSQSSIRASALTLYKQNLLEKIKINNLVNFKISSLGRDSLIHSLNINYSMNRKWDGYWRVFLISKKTNSKHSSTRKIRGVLQKFNFKKLQRGVYIAPFVNSIQKIKQELINNQKLFTQICAFKTKKVYFYNNFELAKKLYNLSLISKGYKNIIKQSKRLLTVLQGKKVLSNQQKKALFPILRDYFSLLEQDPFLPNGVISAQFPRTNCQKTIKKLAKRVKIG